MHPSHEAAIEIEAETVLGENVSTFATLRLPQKGAVDLSTLIQNKIDPEIATYGLWWEGTRAEQAKGVTPANIKAYLAAMGITQSW